MVVNNNIYNFSPRLKIENYKWFCALMVVNLIVDLLPTWQGSFIPVESFIPLIIRIVRFVNLFFILLIFANSRVKNSALQKMIIIVFCAMIISKILNFTFEEITQPIEYLLYNLALFCALNIKYISKKFLRHVTIAIVLWSVIPVVVLPFAPLSVQMMLFATDPDANEAVSTFCGFASHRNAYSYYCGIAFVLTLFSDYNKIVKIFLASVMIVGLFLAASRSCVLALALVTMYYYLFTKGKNKLVFLIIFSAIAYIGYNFAQTTESRLLESGGREELNKSSYEVFMESPIFGHGKSTPTKLVSYNGKQSVPHSWIYSTLMDYGLLGIIPFVITLVLMFKKSSTKSRSLLLYIVIIGIVQPCFGLYAPSQVQLMVYLLMICYNAIPLVDSKEVKKRLFYQNRSYESRNCITC